MPHVVLYVLTVTTHLDACAQKLKAAVVHRAQENDNWDESQQILTELSHNCSVTMSPAMCAHELLLWAKLHQHRALAADQLSSLNGNPQYRHLSEGERAAKLSELQLSAAQHHICCLTACDRAVALLPDRADALLPGDVTAFLEV